MDFKQQQYAFAAHIRDPEDNPAPEGVEDRRMKIYRELFYNNVEGFMRNTYPVLSELLGEERWHEIMRDYFASHLSHTPLFPEMPREFLKYLENEYQSRENDFPFMLELAHYEWVELAMDVLDTDVHTLTYDAAGDLMAGIPLLSPLAWALSYRYPVHLIGPGFIPDQVPEQKTHIVVYRDLDDEVHFLELNPVTMRLLELLQAGTLSGTQALNQIAKEMNHPQPQTLLQFGQQILDEFKQRQIILGTKQ
jgi:hypothetical protein